MEMRLVASGKGKSTFFKGIANSRSATPSFLTPTSRRICIAQIGVNVFFFYKDNTEVRGRQGLILEELGEELN